MRTRFANLVLIMALAFSCLGFSPTMAQIRLGGQIADSSNAVNIAVVDLAGDNLQAVQFGQMLAGIVRDDLTGSGLFDVAASATYPQTAVQISGRPDFNQWATTRLDALVTGRVAYFEDHLEVEYRLFDLKQRKFLHGLRLRANRSSARSIAHKIADQVYEALTGAPGHFSTQIVYIAETGTATNRMKRLAIMDQDGSNVRYLPSQSGINLTPRFSPVNPEITYLSYEDGLPKVYLLDLRTYRKEVLGEFSGMTFSPRFAPDGNRVIFSLSSGDQADLWEMDLRTLRRTQLTNTPAIEASPSYSPDGQQIVFESDRSGDQQLYIMNRNGTGATRISFGQGRYASPVWSPDGRSIAFTRMDGEEFTIGVMDPNGTTERTLSRGFSVEGPSWSPNGRMLTYFKTSRQNADGTGGSAQLYVVDIFSGQERLLPTPTGASDPAWSSTSL